MITKIQKWGNSLALRIPKSYAEDLEFKEGTDIKIKITKNKLVVTRKKKKNLEINSLLSGITEKNLHKEVVYPKPLEKGANE